MGLFRGVLNSISNFVSKNNAREKWDYYVAVRMSYSLLTRTGRKDLLENLNVLPDVRHCRVKHELEQSQLCPKLASRDQLCTRSNQRHLVIFAGDAAWSRQRCRFGAGPQSPAAIRGIVRKFARSIKRRNPTRVAFSLGKWEFTMGIYRRLSLCRKTTAESWNIWEGTSIVTSSGTTTAPPKELNSNCSSNSWNDSSDGSLGWPSSRKSWSRVVMKLVWTYGLGLGVKHQHKDRGVTCRGLVDTPWLVRCACRQSKKERPLTGGNTRQGDWKGVDFWAFWEPPLQTWRKYLWWSSVFELRNLASVSLKLIVQHGQTAAKIGVKKFY